MRNIFICLSLSLITITFQNCSNSFDPGEYISYINNSGNGLNKNITSGPYHFELRYYPQELMLLREYKNDIFNISEDSIQNHLKELKKYQFYHLRLSSAGNADFLKTGITRDNEYFERVAYYTSFAQQDFKLIQGKDTLSCNMYHFERTYGIQPFHTVILGFLNIDEDFEYGRTLLYNDRILGLKPLEIEIASEYLRKIPNLNI